MWDGMLKYRPNTGEFGSMADDWFTDAVATASRESVVRRIPRREQPRHWCWLIFSPGSLLETWTLMSTKFAPATWKLGLWSCCRLNLHSPHLFNLCVLYISSKLNPAVMIIIKKSSILRDVQLHVSDNALYTLCHAHTHERFENVKRFWIAFVRTTALY